MTDITEPPRPPDRSERERAFQARIGTRIAGVWHIDGLLGAGGMAAVYAATHTDGRRAALKVLHRDVVGDKMVSERFLRESHVAERVGHPGCVRVEGDGITEEGEPFLIMELLEGETVRDYWRRTGRRVPIADALRIADGMLDCLAACHAAGIIHRDLKPANVFITVDERIKLLDFGVAQVRDAAADMTTAGTALGTPSYMSPEQAMGLVDEIDGRADVFSVGALLHALIAGERVHRARTEGEALVLAATVPVPSVARLAPDLPLAVVRLIDKALAWDRRSRFADAKEMQAATRETLAALASRSDGPVVLELTSPRSPTMSPPTARPMSGPAPARVSGRLASPVSIVLPQDSRATDLTEVFKLVDRLLPNVQQLGWNHPLTERGLRTVFETWSGLLARDPAFGRLTVWPYSFVGFGETVWEPDPPFDAVPYHLFACGVRQIDVLPGVTYEEVRELFLLLLLDPGRDLPPEDDLAAAFWERGFAHVRWETVLSFVDGDAASREAFYDEADALEALARAEVLKLEADAMALTTDREALESASGASPLDLDLAVKSAFAAELNVSREGWTERYVDALVEGYIDAAIARDAPVVLASLRRSACDLLVANRLDVLVSLHGALRDRLVARVAGDDLLKLAAAISNALFGGEALALAMADLRKSPERVASFEPVLAQLAPRDLSIVLTALEDAPDSLAEALLRYVERVLPGHEAEVAAAARRFSPKVAPLAVAMLARSDSPAAREVLTEIASSDDLELAVEAKILAAGAPEQALAEVVTLLDGDSALLRMAALRALARHGLKGAFPMLARRLRSAAFGDLGTDERRELLRAIVTLSVEHGEPLVMDLAAKSGVFTTEAREGSRAVAMEVLGEISASERVEQELRELAQARWGSSDEVRTAASEAAARIHARRTRSVPPRGSVPPEGVLARAPSHKPEAP